MSRVINTNSPTKIRNQNRRTIAELLQRMAQKPNFDDESKDMAACMVFALNEINGANQSAIVAWEKRDYWMKADRFMREWEWVPQSAANIEDVLRHEAWDLLPELIIGLYPRFTDLQIKTLTRKPILWQGAYEKLMAQPPTEVPY